MVGEDLVCDVVNGRFVDGPSVDALRRSARQAAADGVDAIFLTDGPLGDAIVLAAALAGVTEGLLLGVRVSLQAGPHRHPTLLAREMSTFDHITGGRAVLAFRGPFTGAASGATAEATSEAIALCRDMWRHGVAASDGPIYPVPGAINRPLPQRAGGPPIAVDLTGGDTAPPELLSACDLVLVAGSSPLPAALPLGVEVCLMQDP
jgi:alkanesulfonate monooxygenase SsuD/methylene tetrahydromethanopterin reductase-like flavin-dependent oxidoreductase (luciferase family)